MTNQAIDVNPPFASETITTGGSDWLWTVFAIMLASDLILMAWHFSLPRRQRVFHQLGIVILTVASIAYFSMASDLGGTPIQTEFRQRESRAIWYVRYIMWAITAPLLLLELFLASGLALSDTFTTIVMAIVGVVSGLVGALVSSSYKWGYYAFGLGALFYVAYQVIKGATSARLIGNDLHRAYSLAAAHEVFVWMLFPIAWAVSEGGNVISPNREMVFYGILDILSKPVFLFVFLFLIRRVEFQRYVWIGGVAASNVAASNVNTGNVAKLPAV